MKTRTLKEILSFDSPALTAIIDYWKDYDAKTVLLAYAELKKRKYRISERLTKKQNEFCAKYNNSDIDTFLNNYLKENKYNSYNELYEKETSIKNIFEIQDKELKEKEKSMKKMVFTIIGAILGLPLSYYFQPDMVQAKVGGIGGYIKNFGDILDQKDLMSNVIMGIVVFAVIGFIIGYFMDKNANPKTD